MYRIDLLLHVRIKLYFKPNHSNCLKKPLTYKKLQVYWQLYYISKVRKMSDLGHNQIILFCNTIVVLLTTYPLLLMSK